MILNVMNKIQRHIVHPEQAPIKSPNFFLTLRPLISYQFLKNKISKNKGQIKVKF